MMPSRSRARFLRAALLGVLFLSAIGLVLIASGTRRPAPAVAGKLAPGSGSAAAVAAGPLPCAATMAIQAPYSDNYSCADLGAVSSLPVPYGGLTFRLGDPNTIIIGGTANTADGNLYSISVVRDASQHITGFSGEATFFAAGAYNDGGVVYGPGNVLFLARWPSNELGETKLGSTATDLLVDLSPYNSCGSDSALAFVPAGFPGAGQLKLVTYSDGCWYTASLEANAGGTYDITGLTRGGGATGALSIVGGPEGFIYVPPGSPNFADYDSMLVSEYGGGNIAAYQLDANGDPNPTSRQTFLSGLAGAEGAAIDPLTGDFIFSTFGGDNHVVRVSGFAVPPTATPTPSASPSPSATQTATPTASFTPTRTSTPTPSFTPTHTATATRPPATPTRTPTATRTPSFTPTPGSPTATRTPSFTPTRGSPTATRTPSFTPTLTNSATPTFSPTVTNTVTPTFSPTFTDTATHTNTPTATPSRTPTPVPTSTATPFAPTATNASPPPPAPTNTPPAVSGSTQPPAPTSTRTPVSGGGAAVAGSASQPSPTRPKATSTRAPTPTATLVSSVLGATQAPGGDGSNGGGAAGGEHLYHVYGGGYITGPEPRTAGSVLSFSDISHSPKVIGTNILLAIILLIILLIGSTVFNNTLDDHRVEMQALGMRLLSPFRGLFGSGQAARATGGPGLLTAVIGPLLVLGVTCLIYSFNESGFGLNGKTAAFFSSLVISVGVMTYVGEGGEALITRHRFRTPAGVRLYPVAILLAAGFVVLSRITSFQAPIMYGFVATATVLAAAEMEHRHSAQAVAIPAILLLAVSLAAWALLVPLRHHGANSAHWWAHLPSDSAALIFAGGIEGLLFTMIPIRFNDGAKIFRWYKLIWLPLFAIPAFLFSWVILNPQAQGFDAAIHGRVIFAVSLVTAFTLATCVVWAYFYFRDESQSPPDAPKTPSGGDPRYQPLLTPAERGAGAQQPPRLPTRRLSPKPLDT